MPDRVEPYTEKRRPSLPERKRRFTTVSGIPVDRTYTDKHVNKRDRSEPGEFPFVRGVHPSGYRSRLWTMRMFAGFGSAEETNSRFKYLLEQGQTGRHICQHVAIRYCRQTIHDSCHA